MTPRTNPVHTTIIPLGTGGYIPTQIRETAAVLVRRGQTAILFDAGTGVARLLEPEFRAHLSGIACLNVVLSHYHLDHVIGLTWLPKVWNSELRIFAPSEPLVGVRAESALRRLTGAPLFALPLEEYPFPITIVPVSTEAPIEIDDITVRVLRQEHAGGSIGFRVDDCFAYITDTDPGDRHVAFLANVRLALIDAFYDATEYRTVRSITDDKLDHGSNLGAALTAKEAGVQKLGLIHINPSYTAQRCETMLEESRSVVPSTMLPADGVPISV